MPLYEFQCKNCGQINEVLMKVTDPSPDACSECKQGPLVKLMSRTNFVLKGQGWYETDFKSKPKAKTEPTSAGESSSSDAKSSPSKEESTASKAGSDGAKPKGNKTASGS